MKNNMPKKATKKRAKSKSTRKTTAKGHSTSTKEKNSEGCCSLRGFFKKLFS